ncbi:MAG: ABC transporter ATP-binding protein [Lacisediminihabitans sp.]
MLEIRDLSKSYVLGPRQAEPVLALSHVDLDLAEGEFVTVLGHSGSGKTTLLRSIAGFEFPETGSIRVAGRTVLAPGARTVPAHDRGIGLVAQEGALFPHLTVAQNVGFGLPGHNKRARREVVDEVLELVGLGGFGKRWPHQLSGGQQQRVALARAIAPNPRIVLLDEPFSSLDAYLRDALRTEVRDLLKSIGATVLLVTHDQEEALALGDRVVVMRDGQIVQAGEPHETYFQPFDIELARFLGDAIVIDGDVVDDGVGVTTVSCAFGKLNVASWHGCAGKCDVLIRPENIHVSAADAPTEQSNNGCSLVGVVLAREFYGHDGVLKVKVPEIEEQVPVRVLGDHSFGLGEQVRLYVDRPVSTYAQSTFAQ